jgi:hypothetical protein
MTDAANTLGTRKLAARLEMNPKALRALLRSMGKGAKKGGYRWKENDVPNLIAAIKEHEQKSRRSQ